MGGVVYVQPESYNSSEGISIDYTGVYNSNYNGLTNNLGLSGKSDNFSYMIRADVIDNGEFSTPDGEIENTWFTQNNLKAGIAYETDNFKSDLRFSLTNSEIGIPHMDEEHDDHGDDDHDDSSSENEMLTHPRHLYIEGTFYTEDSESCEPTLKWLQSHPQMKKNGEENSSDDTFQIKKLDKLYA